MATHPTPWRAATGHSEAETSLTRVAPAATAASATAALVVSIDTRTSPASASMTGITRRSSSSTGHRLGAGPGGLPAHVDDVGPLGDHLAALRDGPPGLEPPPAVGERVGGDVEDPHHQWTVLTGRAGHDDTA